MFGIDVMLVDDEDGVRTALAEFLRLHGYRVVDVDSVRDALETLSVTRPRMLICDERLGDASGMVVIEDYAKKTDAGRAALSTADERPDVTRFLVAHPNVDRLPKPLAPKALLAWVEKAVNWTGSDEQDGSRRRKPLEQVIDDEVLRRRVESILEWLSPSEVCALVVEESWIRIEVESHHANTLDRASRSLPRGCDIWPLERVGRFALRIHRIDQPEQTTSGSMFWAAPLREVAP